MRRTVNVVESLLESSARDAQLLETFRRQGDLLSVPRPVRFRLVGQEHQQVDRVAQFITDNGYGRPRVETSGDRHVLSVEVDMPLTPPVLSCVSGLMTSVAAVFSLAYDGWDAQIERPIA